MLIERIINSGIDRPDKTAIISGGKCVTYRELLRQSRIIAGFMDKKGLNKNARVLVLGRSSDVFVKAFYASLYYGAIYVPVSTDLSLAKVKYILQDVKPSLIIMPEMYYRKVCKLVNSDSAAVILLYEENKVDGIYDLKDVDTLDNVINSADEYTHKNEGIDQDLACIIYTSGSTGTPKGIMLTNLNMMAASESILDYLDINENDRIACSLPLSFDYGLYQYLLAHQTGATVMLDDCIFMQEFLENLIKNSCTILPLVPSMINLMIMSCRSLNIDTGCVKKITNTAAALQDKHINYLKEKFPNAKIYSMYGLTECKRITFLPPDEVDKKRGSVGKGMTNQELFLVNEEDAQLQPGGEGELVVRGSHVMRGYWNKPEETAKYLKYRNDEKGICLYTGDIFRQDKEGYLYFVGRRDDMIKSHGQKVSLVEVENILSGISWVDELAAVGISDEISGQSYYLFIATDTSPDRKKEIYRYCKANLDRHMLPKKIIMITEIPKNSNGKIDKVKLRDIYGHDG